jgi:competence protein ComEC
MQRLVVALAATICGLAVAPIYSLPTAPGLGVGVFFLGLFLFYRGVPCRATFCLFIVFFVCANLRYPLQLAPRAAVVEIDQRAQKFELTAAVSQVVHLTDNRSRIDLQARQVGDDNGPIPLQRDLPVRLYSGDNCAELLPGDLIRCRSRLRRPRRFGTPGEFHWPRYLAGQNIAMTAWIKSCDQIELLGKEPAFPTRLIARWRQRVGGLIQARLPEPRAQLVRALTLGEGRVLPDRIREILSASGISHLFAISGLHLGLIAALGYALLARLYRRSSRLLEWQPPQRVVPLLLVPLLFAYLLLTGDALSTRRAFLLFALGAGFFAWRYLVNPLLFLASLALFSLLYNPLFLWQAGWQLSFAGAAGILLWRPWWQAAELQRRSFWLRYPLQLLLVSLAAILCTTPLVLANFHTLAPAALVANLICVPLITFCILPLGLFALVLSMVQPDGAILLFQGCGFLLESLLLLADYLRHLPGLQEWKLFLSRWQYLAVAVGLLPLILGPRLPAGRRRLALSGVALLLATCVWQLSQAETRAPSVTLFSVGQGESLLLRNAQGQALLVDGGGLYSDRFDVGERLLAPAFGELGVSQLDAIVLSHDHPDHRKGLIYILNHYPVARFISGHPLKDLHPDLQQVLRQQEIPVVVARPGWSSLKFWLTNKLLLYQGAEEGFSENDSSLAIYLRGPNEQGLLLTGDLGRSGIEKLLEVGIPGPVSLLKLPHHGSRYSAIGRLVEQTEPDYGLVSAGYQNRYRLPADEVVDFLRQQRISLARTDQDGTIRARLLEDGWRIERWQRGFFR